MTTSTATLVDREILSVTALNQNIRKLIENNFGQIWVEGEVSNFVCPSSGHWYFTLKDAKAQVRCAMFSNRNRRLQIPIKNGMQVILRGKASLFEGRGEYQLIAENLIESGTGLLQQHYEALKRTLAEKGLFDPQHKKPLPSLPKHIGVITSPTGAAIHDILTVLQRRFPAIPVTVIPAMVQGKAAAPDIVGAIKLAHKTLQLDSPVAAIDVLIVGRGGGSLEDLRPFNEEIVAEAIFNSEIPIVSAVGHEVDFSIADFVADQRAATPSAAAELLSPDASDWLQKLARFEQYFLDRQVFFIGHKQHQLTTLQKRLRHPGRQLQEHAQRLDDFEVRMKNSMRNALALGQSTLNTRTSELMQCQPSHKINNMKLCCQQLSQTINHLMLRKLQGSRQRMDASAQALHTLSPLQTLGRGFAVVKDAQGRILRAANRVQVGDPITTQLAKGRLNCIVEKIDESGSL
jgi:exodeoxyribonuclease VII large subunit